MAQKKIYTPRTLKYMGVKLNETSMNYTDDAQQIREVWDDLGRSIGKQTLDKAAKLRSKIAALTRSAYAKDDEQMKKLVEQFQDHSKELQESLSNALKIYEVDMEIIWSSIQKLVSEDAQSGDPKSYSGRKNFLPNKALSDELRTLQLGGIVDAFEDIHMTCVQQIQDKDPAIDISKVEEVDKHASTIQYHANELLKIRL